MNHIDGDWLHLFANEIVDLSEAEIIHLDECAVCWKRFTLAVQLVVTFRTEPENQLVN